MFDLRVVPDEKFMAEYKRRLSCAQMPNRSMILIGPPGCGKGTQAPKIAEKYCMCHVSTGDILRDEVKRATPLGLRIKEVINKGDLVSDDMMIDLVKTQMKRPECSKGLLLDGFPRTERQAERLETELEKVGQKLEKVIHFKIDDSDLVERIDGRLTHPASGRTYHPKLNPPKLPGRDDVTGEPLIKRDDDNVDVLKRRLTNYHTTTKPLLEYFTKKNMLRTVQAKQPMDMVTKAIFGYIDQ